MGLALVEYVVRSRRGEVRAESRVGAGSTFGFWPPVDDTGTGWLHGSIVEFRFGCLKSRNVGGLYGIIPDKL
jgi:hypothetical protein